MWASVRRSIGLISRPRQFRYGLADGLYAHLWGVQAGEIDSLPQAFIERAARRQARTETAEDD